MSRLLCWISGKFWITSSARPMASGTSRRSASMSGHAVCTPPCHSSSMYVKRNIFASTFIPHRLLSQQEFSRYALDYLVFGNAYLEERQNRLGVPLQVEILPGQVHAARRGSWLVLVCAGLERGAPLQDRQCFSPD